MVKRVWWDGLTAPREASLLVEDRGTMLAVAIATHPNVYNETNWRVPSKNVRGFWTVYPASADANSGTGSPSS